MKIKPTIVWTWAIDWYGKGNYELCWFCYRTKQALIDDGKPSPEAKAVKVEMRSISRNRK